jgi:cytochrome c biogenesis protein CcmG/thiol:disulfide interchange protein DsbE
MLIYGINYKDTRTDAMQWLQHFGDPYRASAFDQHGLTGIDLGVYGVPETYIIDRTGIIRYKHIGPITREVLDNTILPLIEKLKASGT